MSSRRQFLHQASTAALAATSSTLFGRLLSAQAASTSDQTARLYIDSRRTISPLDRNLFGSFLEQLGRAIYEGVYDPGSKLSDSNGFRKDVMGLQANMNDPTVLSLGTLTLGSGCDAVVAGSSGLCPGNVPLPYPTFTGTVAQALRAFPQYQNIIWRGVPLGSSMLRWAKHCFGNKKQTKQSPNCRKPLVLIRKAEKHITSWGWL